VHCPLADGYNRRGYHGNAAGPTCAFHAHTQTHRGVPQVEEAENRYSRSHAYTQNDEKATANVSVNGRGLLLPRQQKTFTTFSHRLLLQKNTIRYVRQLQIDVAWLPIRTIIGTEPKGSVPNGFLRYVFLLLAGSIVLCATSTKHA